MVRQQGNPKDDTSLFEFVSISHPSEFKDQLVKRKIRQHAMKEIGLLRRKRNRNEKLNSSSKKNQVRLQTPSLQSETILQSPTRVRAQSMNDFLFRRHSAYCMKVRELCFSLALFDDGVYYLARAEMAIHDKDNEQYLLPHKENDTSLKYYSQSIAHMNQHMQRAFVTGASEHEVLCAVLGLASYDVSVGNMKRWEIHMAGLKSLMQNCKNFQPQKSGFFMLSLLWTETTGCLVLDRETHVEVPVEALQPVEEPISNAILSRNLVALKSMGSRFDNIAYLLESSTGLVKSFSLQRSREDDPYTVYCITRARASYILLNLPRLDKQTWYQPTTEDAVYEAIRLAMLAFLLNMVGFAIPGGILSHHADRLIRLMASHKTSWIGFEELQLWVLTVGYVATNNAVHRTALSERIAALMAELGLHTVTLSEALSRVAWCNGLFEDPLRDLQASLPPILNRLQG